jgi:GlpG protein
MRLIYTTEDQKKARTLSAFFTSKGIKNELELVPNTDWGSPEYGNILGRLWVIEEEDVQKAMQWVDEYDKDPDKPIFQVQTSPLKAIEPSFPIFGNHAKISIDKQKQLPPKRPPVAEKGSITWYIFLFCVLIFITSSATTPPLQTPPPGIPLTPLFSAPINKTFFYDWPHKYELVDKLVKAYGIEKLEDPALLSPEGLLIYEKIALTPIWKGFYEMAVRHYKTPSEPLSFDAPLFEKIREGELWRVITPCFLHSDIFHLLFNMIWLIVLGKQIEQRMKPLRYVLFILITGIVTNTAQYLMTGSDFLGISGVLCAMLSFIWVRQRKAAWEGYRMDRSTFAMMGAFIVMMFAIQVFYFFMEVQGLSTDFMRIANTAHLSGIAIGYIIGKIDTLAVK